MLLVVIVSGCTPRNDRVEMSPAAARYSIAALLPAHVRDPAGWAEDIYTAFEALDIKVTTQNICAVVAVTDQESTFEVNPAVPNLPVIARREIDSRAARYHIPKFMVSAALNMSSPNGRTYSERLARVKTEQELSDIFEEFIDMVPLGKRLFGDFNPVRTGGPMQVSIAFAHESGDHYPYSNTPDIRREVFTRRGGMYFGIAHLLDYDVSYDRMLYRFADFNAGHYASRNAAFQNAVALLTGRSLALDGDLILYEGEEGEVSQTEQAVRSLHDRLGVSLEEIGRDLRRGREHDFERTTLYRRVFELADAKKGTEVPRAMVPHIRLQSAKITRKLTTEWFATRVDQRYRKCLARGSTNA